mgnify:CR=1 FL=1
MGNVQALIIQQMIDVFGDHPSDNPSGVYRTYQHHLGGFSDEVLTKGWARVSGDYFPSKRNPWPAPAIVKRACDAEFKKECEAEHASRARQRQQGSKDYARADKMIQSATGRVAAEEGWILGLWEHYAEYGCEPHQGQISKFKQSAADDEWTIKLRNEGIGWTTAAMRKLQAALDARRKEKCELALHGVIAGRV